MSAVAVISVSVELRPKMKYIYFSLSGFMCFMSVCRVVFSTTEVRIVKNSELLSFNCRNLNVTCDGHVMLTIEVSVYGGFM